MRLSLQDALLFFKLHRSLMCFANEQLQVVPGIVDPDQFGTLQPDVRLKVRQAFLENSGLIDTFLGANPHGLQAAELDMVAEWRHQVAGKFFIFRYLKSHAIFLDATSSPTAYGVVALADPFETVIGPDPPYWVETVLLPFKGKIVYDGLLAGQNISFGPGIRRMLTDSYQVARVRLGIVVTLPVGAAVNRPAKKKSPKSKTKKLRLASDEAGEVLGVVVNLIDEFCREHLNDEYAVLCRKLAEKLARKRPSPLLGGKPNTWACAIVRTIGWANFLDDNSRRPHMKLTAIDRAFGVGESTGQGKSLLIRRMLKIRQFDHHWLLPSRLDDYPMVWMVNVNGFVLDVRRCTREVQEAAFKKGLIPYVPADRD